jgi:hypothetical protein
LTKNNIQIAIRIALLNSILLIISHFLQKFPEFWMKIKKDYFYKSNSSPINKILVFIQSLEQAIQYDSEQ